MRRSKKYRLNKVSEDSTRLCDFSPGTVKKEYERVILGKKKERAHLMVRSFFLPPLVILPEFLVRCQLESTPFEEWLLSHDDSSFRLGTGCVQKGSTLDISRRRPFIQITYECDIMMIVIMIEKIFLEDMKDHSGVES